MNKLMSELKQEHKGLHRLIALLQIKLDKLNQGKKPDFNLMEDAINYIKNFADAYHHPKEDVIYHYIIDHQLDKQGLFAAIINEHKAFVQNTKNLKQAIQAILMDHVVPRDLFIDQLAGFIHAERSHLKQEDTIIFPLVESSLTEQDWDIIEHSIPAKVEDPLFGAQVKSEYRSFTNVCSKRKQKTVKPQFYPAAA